MTNDYPCLPDGPLDAFRPAPPPRVLAFWLVVLLAGGFASTRLSPLLSNTFAVPGTDSEHVRQLLETHFGDRSDGAFTVVFRVRDATEPRLVARLQAASSRAPRRSSPPASRRRCPSPARHVVYGDIVSRLNVAQAKAYTEPAAARARPPGGRPARLRHRRRRRSSTTSTRSSTRTSSRRVASRCRSRCSCCSPCSASRWAVTIPFSSPRARSWPRSGSSTGSPTSRSRPTYATNLVQLIGLGIAVDYSLLIVYRFREELARGPSRRRGGGADDGDRGPRGHLLGRRGRARPRAPDRDAAAVHADARDRRLPDPDRLDRSPRRRSSRCCSRYYGRRGIARKRILPGAPTDPERGFWARLARSIMARPVVYLVSGIALLLAAAVPAFFLQVTPGSTFGIPRWPAVDPGLRRCFSTRSGPGAVAPSQVLVEARTGSVLAPATQAAIGRLVAGAPARPGGGGGLLGAGGPLRRRLAVATSR